MSKTIPSGLAGGTQVRASPASVDADHETPSFGDLMFGGFRTLSLLKYRHGLSKEADFAILIERFLDAFAHGAEKLDISNDDVIAAQYAFCAAVDELILTSKFKIRDAWKRRPLRLNSIGDNLSGEDFFVHLQNLRKQGAQHLQALEVFYICLLLGYRGKYQTLGPEKLADLVGELTEEIAQKRVRAPFAPHWELPDHVAHPLKRKIPIWVIASVLASIGLLTFIGLRLMLDRFTNETLVPYAQIVKPVGRE